MSFTIVEIEEVLSNNFIKSESDFRIKSKMGIFPQGFPKNLYQEYKKYGKRFSWTRFTGNISPNIKNLAKPSFEHIRSQVQEIGIWSQADYEKYRRRNPHLQWPLHIEREVGFSDIYDFLGKHRPYTKGKTIEIIISENIKSPADYKRLYKRECKQSRPVDSSYSGLRCVPTTVFKCDWEDLIPDYSNRLIRFEKWKGKYEEYKFFFHNLLDLYGIEINEGYGYKECRRFIESNKLQKKLLLRPDHFFKDDLWQGWPSFYDNHRIGYGRDYMSKSEFISLLKQNKIKNIDQYDNFRKQNPSFALQSRGRVPLYYGETLHELLGKGGRRKNPLYNDFKLLHDTVLGIGFESREDYENKCEHYGMPKAPFNVNKSLWVSWANFLGIDRNQSKGEKEIEDFLITKKVRYIKQFSPSGCKYVKPLRFDFHLPNHRILIEFQGEQHYKSVEYFGGAKSFKHNQERDKIKKNYCISNGIHLICISYIHLRNRSISQVLNKVFDNLNEFLNTEKYYHHFKE